MKKRFLKSLFVKLVRIKTIFFILFKENKKSKLKRFVGQV